MQYDPVIKLTGGQKAGNEKRKAMIALRAFAKGGKTGTSARKFGMCCNSIERWSER